MEGEAGEAAMMWWWRTLGAGMCLWTMVAVATGDQTTDAARPLVLHLGGAAPGLLQQQETPPGLCSWFT
jgi:hypothetical protein